MAQFRSMLEGLLESGRIAQQEVWYDAKSRDSGLAEILNRSTSRVRVLAGELDPAYFERDEVIDSIRHFLDKNEKSELQIMFHKTNGSIANVLTAIRKENPKLVSLINSYDSRIQCYWLPKRPTHHYVVGDAQNLLLEEPNHPEYSPRSALGRYNDAKLAPDWIKRYENTLSKATSIKFKE